LIIDVENFGRTSEVAEPPPQQEAAHKGGGEKQMTPVRTIFVHDNFTIVYIRPAVMVLL
jgi:hypothetical protein